MSKTCYEKERIVAPVTVTPSGVYAYGDPGIAASDPKINMLMATSVTFYSTEGEELILNLDVPAPAGATSFSFYTQSSGGIPVNVLQAGDTRKTYQKDF